MKYVIERDPAYAPCGYLLCKVDLQGQWSTRDEASTTLFDVDWDFPSLAGLVGYVPCENGCTDGTITCECTRKTATNLISEAMDMLDANLGMPFESVTAEDYFAEGE